MNKKFNQIFYTLFFGTVLFLIFEIDKLDNTFDGKFFFLLTGGIGIIIAILSIYILRKSLIRDNDRDTIKWLPLVFFMLFPAFGNFINHQFPHSKILTKEFKVLKKARMNRKGTGRKKNIEIRTKNGIERIIVKDSIWENVYEGKTVVFHTQIGFFNFEFVKEIKLK
jgi:hypothetical protein